MNFWDISMSNIFIFQAHVKYCVHKRRISYRDVTGSYSDKNKKDSGGMGYLYRWGTHKYIYHTCTKPLTNFLLKLLCYIMFIRYNVVDIKRSIKISSKLFLDTFNNDILNGS